MPKKNQTASQDDDDRTMEAQESPGEPSMAPGPTTMLGPSAQPLDVVDVLLAEIMPDPLNPNEQTPETFNTLVSTISEDGFDQPLVICPISDQERITLQAPPEVRYVIAKGEHRWRSAREPLTCCKPWSSAANGSLPSTNCSTSPGPA